MSNEKGAGKVINIIKCVGGGQWNDVFMYNRKEGERESNTKVLLVNLHITQSICVEGLNFIFCILIWYQILPYYLYPFSIIYCFLCNCNGHSIAYDPITII